MATDGHSSDPLNFNKLRTSNSAQQEQTFNRMIDPILKVRQRSV